MGLVVHHRTDLPPAIRSLSAEKIWGAYVSPFEFKGTETRRFNGATKYINRVHKVKKNLSGYQRA